MFAETAVSKDARQMDRPNPSVVLLLCQQTSRGRAAPPTTALKESPKLSLSSSIEALDLINLKIGGSASLPNPSNPHMNIKWSTNVATPQ